MVGSDPAIKSVRLLGGVHAVAVDGSAIDLPSASQRRLLAILALHSPRRLRSEWLADILGISPGALRMSVSRLRAVIGGAVLQTASTGYSVVADVDALQFSEAVAGAADADDRLRGLERALGLWIGPALEEFSGEEWADGEIARLTELHAGTVDDYAEELISARRSADAVAVLEAQVARHPYRDSSRGLLIRALASAGRQGDALRAFQQYRSLLIEELGTEPSPDVVRIERRVATSWVGIDTAIPTPTPPAPIDAVTVPLPSALAHEARFVGRVERAGCARRGARARARFGIAGRGAQRRTGHRQDHVVGGIRASRWCRRPTRPSSTGGATRPGYRSNRSAACWPTASNTRRSSLLAEHVARCGGELVRICPRLATRVETAPDPTVSDDATERFLVFEAAADLLRRIATPRPLVLMFDDLQWAEPTALLMLRHITHALADAPVLIVASSREAGEHASEQLRAALADLERGEHRGLQLAGFDDDELADLVASAAPVTDDVEARRVAVALRVETAGQPALRIAAHPALGRVGPLRRCGRHRIDLPAASEEDVPPSLRDVVWSRVNALGDDASRILTAASVLGIEFSEDVLVDMIGLPESVVVETLDTATRAGLLVDAGSVRRSTAVRARARRQRVVRRPGAIAARPLARTSGPLARKARRRHRARRRGPARAALCTRRLARRGAAVVDARRRSGVRTARTDRGVAPLPQSRSTWRSQCIVPTPNAPICSYGSAMRNSGPATRKHKTRSRKVPTSPAAAARTTRSSGLRSRRTPASCGSIRVHPSISRPSRRRSRSRTAADTATYARLLALLAQSLVCTPDAERRVASAHQALELADAHHDPTLLARIAPGVLCGLWEPGAATSGPASRRKRSQLPKHPATRDSNSAPISRPTTSRSNPPIM